MTTRTHKKGAAIAAFLVFAVLQIYVQVGLARPGDVARDNPAAPASPRQQIVGTLTTTGNKPILVNGNNAGSDTTILTGSTLETPPGVSATLSLGPLGKIDLQPGASIKIDYSAGTIRVTILKGCLTLNANPGTTATAENSAGQVLGTTDPAKGGIINACADTKPGTANTVPGPVAGAAAGGGGGISGTTVGLVILGAGVGGAVIAVATRGGGTAPTPSPFQ